MDLNTLEKKLWDEFAEALFDHLNEEYKKLPEDPLIREMMFESAIDTFTDINCMIPRKGISQERATTIIRGVTYLLKKKLSQ